MKVETQIKDTYLEALFNRIYAIHEAHGYKICNSWESWSTLNQYYPCHLTDGDYLVTNEYNDVMRFENNSGSHPIFGSHLKGDRSVVFTQLQELLGLELVEDIDAHNSMTYPRHRNRYWKITKPIES